MSGRGISTLVHHYYLNVVFPSIMVFFNYVNLSHLYRSNTHNITITLEGYLRRNRRSAITVACLLNRLVYLHTRLGHYVFDDTLRPAVMCSIQRFGDI